MPKHRTGKGPRRNQELEASWRQQIANHAKSGLSVRQFCQRHDLKEPAFYAWRRELARRDGERQSSAGKPRQTSASFLPVTLTPDVPAPLEIILPNKVHVKVANGCHEHLLRMALGALETK